MNMQINRRLHLFGIYKEIPHILPHFTLTATLKYIGRVLSFCSDEKTEPLLRWRLKSHSCDKVKFGPASSDSKSHFRYYS